MARIPIITRGHDVGELHMTEYSTSFTIHSILMNSPPSRDDHFYQIQSDRSQIFSEKETLEKVYQMLLEEHRTLQTYFDDVVAEKEEALVRLKEFRREVDIRRNDKADVTMRAEIERLRADL